MAEGEITYFIKAFIYIFMMQGLFSLIINSASLYTTIYTADSSLVWSDYVGLAIWVVGFCFEIIGDHQLKVHIADKTPGKCKFIKWGLWRYTRHPNYFGEAVLWWGIWIIACSNKNGWITFYAPLFLTLLVRYVSGVPLLERKYESQLDWQQYCHETNCFIPWFVNTTDFNLFVQNRIC